MGVNKVRSSSRSNIEHGTDYNSEDRYFGPAGEYLHCNSRCSHHFHCVGTDGNGNAHIHFVFDGVTQANEERCCGERLFSVVGVSHRTTRCIRWPGSALVEGR